MTDIVLPAAAPRPWARRLRRIARDILLIVVVTYLGLCVLLYWKQEQMIFPRDYAPKPATGGPAGAMAGAEEWHVDQPGGDRVVAWFIPAAGSNAPPGHPAPVVIYCHGNAEIIDQQQGPVALFHALGCSVLLPEYRGYGRSSGHPSEAAIRQDLLAFYDILVARKDVDTTRLVYYGHSLGGGVAGDLADAHPPRCVILESTFSSMGAMAHEFFYVPSFLVRHPFRTDLVLARINVPVLIFHGRLDRTIPVTHARYMHALLPQSEYVEYAGDDNDLLGPLDAPDYRMHVTEFLKRCGVVGSR